MTLLIYLLFGLGASHSPLPGPQIPVPEREVVKWGTGTSGSSLGKGSPGSPGEAAHKRAAATRRPLLMGSRR